MLRRVLSRGAHSDLLSMTGLKGNLFAALKDRSSTEKRMTSAFIRNLNVTPKTMPMASLANQFPGRTKPSSLKGVRDQRAHTRTSTAPKGIKTAFPKRISSIARIPRGPNPRREAVKGSSGIAGRAPVDGADSDNCATWSGVGDNAPHCSEYGRRAVSVPPKMTSRKH
jgi:hypothetical protein